MGILYSHIVFQPPSPPSYTDDAGIMTFRKARHDADDDSEDDATVQTEINTNAASVGGDAQYVQHPIFYLETSRGNTIPAAYFHQPDSYYTILFSHGNGEDLGVTSSYVLELSNQLKTSVLCYDYSGYGLSTGKSSEANCYADIDAAYNYLVSEKRIAPNRIVLFGRSLGSGPTVELASRLGPNLAGVVLIASLTSCVRVVFNSPSTLKFDMFANIDKIARVRVPVFCVHGMMDDVVPFSHGVELARRARFPLEPLWIRGAGHNNLEGSRFQYEVFLRYMKVLAELRRWHPPTEQGDGAGAGATTNRRRESFGALVKAAGCFGSVRGDDESRIPRRRVSRQSHSSPSSGHIVMPTLAPGLKHEADLKAMWCERDDTNGLLRRGSAGDRRTERRSRLARKGSVDSARASNTRHVQAAVV